MYILLPTVPVARADLQRNLSVSFYRQRKIAEKMSKINEMISIIFILHYWLHHF